MSETSDIVFSIVIPTFNRPADVLGCLGSIEGLDYPPDRYEVILVDDGGVHPLDSIVDLFREAMSIQLIRQENAGPAAARNTGVEKARGKYIAFTDDDCRPDPDWLTAFEAMLEADPERLYGGRTVNGLEDNPYSDASQVIIDIVYAHFNRDPDNARMFTSNNMAVQRASLIEAGGFDANLRISEDRELCDRWIARGGKLLYVPGAEIVHEHAMSLKGFWRQHFSYGGGAVAYQRIRRARGSGSMVKDSGFHLRFYQWIGIPFRGVSLARGLRRTALLAVWQVATAMGYIRARMADGRGERL